MNAKETIEAGKLMVEYGEEWERTGKEPECNLIQHKMGGVWYDLDSSPLWNWGKTEYRRRPEPKIIPFGPGDITPGMQFRLKGQLTWAIASRAIITVVLDYPIRVDVTYDELLEKYECRAIGETEWRPCGKTVV